MSSLSVLNPPRRGAAKNARRGVALLLALTIGVGACKSIEKALPYLIVAGGAIASVVALNFLSSCGKGWAVCHTDSFGNDVLDSGYSTQVLLTIGTLTTVAGAAADYFVDQRQKKRELADLEKADHAVEQQYAGLQAAQPQGNAAGWTSWGSPPPGSEPARWGNVAPTPAFQQSAGGESGWQQPGSENPWGDKYGSSGVTPRSADAPLAIDVAMIKRAFVAGQERMVPFNDGAVLLDGRGENVEDRFRVYFSPTADAYVYVVGVDAVGRVQPLFPRRFPDQTNPIRAGERVLLPDGTNWYGLDEYSGIQHIFVRVSPEPLHDLEMQLTLFAANPPPSLPTTGKIFTVSQAMQADAKVQGRGITGTDVEPVKLPPEIGDLEFVPLRVEAQAGTDEVATVRYFQHG
jgi:hypothetical protein